MDERVNELLRKHQDDKDLTSEKDYIKPGWNWFGADLRGWNLSNIKFSTVSKPANFNTALFENANLSGAILIGAKMQDVGLQKVKLNDADLRWVNLENSHIWESDMQNTNLQYANFKNTRIDKSNFKNSNFENANLQGAYAAYANFENANLDNASLIETELMGAKFSKCSLYRTKLSGSALKGAIIDTVIIQEINKEYEKAIEIYGTLRLYFLSVGNNSTAGKYYYRKKIMEQKSSKEMKKYLRWITLTLSQIFFGFGEHPLRLLILPILLLPIFALIAYCCKGITYNVSINKCFLNYQATFWECLYFSNITFTSIGYGDFIPKPNFQWVISIYSIIGAIFWALFAALLGKRYIR